MDIPGKIAPPKGLKCNLLSFFLLDKTHFCIFAAENQHKIIQSVF